MDYYEDIVARVLLSARVCVRKKFMIVIIAAKSPVIVRSMTGLPVSFVCLPKVIVFASCFIVSVS